MSFLFLVFVLLSHSSSLLFQNKTTTSTTTDNQRKSKPRKKERKKMTNILHTHTPSLCIHIIDWPRLEEMQKERGLFLQRHSLQNLVFLFLFLLFLFLLFLFVVCGLLCPSFPLSLSLASVFMCHGGVLNE